MQIAFAGPVFSWRGPAPFHFVRVPDDEAAQIKEVAGAISSGWGMVPAAVVVGASESTTALWPKDGSFYVPLKDAVRRAEGIGLGDVVEVRLVLAV